MRQHETGEVSIAAPMTNPFNWRAEVFDPATGSFVSVAKDDRPKHQRGYHGYHGSVGLQDGKVLILGGKSQLAYSLREAELFDPASNRFSPTGSMVLARARPQSVLLNDGTVLVTGASDLREKTFGEIYQPATGAFSRTKGSMVENKYHHSSTLLKDGRVLLTGGQLTGGEVVATAEIYDPATGKFTVIGKMTSPRTFHTACLLKNGRVLLAGGVNGRGIGRPKFAPEPALASAEVFDPATNRFSPTGRMAIGRQALGSALLKDGTVLIGIGQSGYGIGGPLLSLEVYDPATGKFTAMGSMTRKAQRMLRLPDGSVLFLAGGRPASVYRAVSRPDREQKDK